jgi:hypothetical protein
MGRDYDALSSNTGVDVRAPGTRLGGYLVGPRSLVDSRAYPVTRDPPIGPPPGWLTTKLTTGTVGGGAALSGVA